MKCNCACKGCTERYIGCHSVCDKYKKFKEEEKAKHELRYKDDMLLAYLKESCARMKQERVRYRTHP